MLTNIQQDLTRPPNSDTTTLQTALSFAGGHPTARAVALWGALQPFTPYLFVPAWFLLGAIATQVHAATTTPNTTAAAGHDQAPTRQFTMFARGLKTSVVVAAITLIPTGLQTASLIGYFLLAGTTPSLRPLLVPAVAIWSLLMAVLPAVLLPAGFIRTVRTGQLSAAASRYTLVATTSVAYLKAIFLAYTSLALYTLLLPVSLLLPVVGTLAWCGVGAVLLSGHTIHIAANTPGRPNEFEPAPPTARQPPTDAADTSTYDPDREDTPLLKP